MTAVVALLAVLLAQIAAAAYACTEQSPVQTSTASHSAMVTHCADMDGASVSNPKLCYAHCGADSQLDSQPQTLMPLIALSPPLTLTLPTARIPKEVCSLR